MLPARLADRPGGLRILFVGAHCDDIEIGCGGTVLRLLQDYSVAAVKWVVLTSNEIRSQEAESCAHLFLETAREKDVVIHSLKDGRLPFFAPEVKDLLEGLKIFKPDLIFTHARHDRHQDHKTVAEITWNTFRDHLVFEYEIPKYEGDLGQPNFFVAIPQDLAAKKADAIVGGYPSQSSKQWFDRDTFLSLMRIRGLECASATRYAEGFYVSKLLM